MSSEENKVIVRKMFEAVNERNLALLDGLAAHDYADHYHQLHGLENTKRFLGMLIAGFPDFHMTIEDMITVGDKVWVRSKQTGTHTGEFRGLVPTGRKIAFMGIDVFTVFGDKVTEVESVYDLLDFFKQLGVIEYTEKAKTFFSKPLS
jgi:predicted ester cyclase